MSELKQIAAVLRNLGITFKHVDFVIDGEDVDPMAISDECFNGIRLVLNYKGILIHKSYTIEEIRSELLTEPRTQPAGPQRLDRLADKTIRRTKSI